MHALREFIYVYVFTERIGEIIINGLAFPGSCEPLGTYDHPNVLDTGSSCIVSEQTGLERVIKWYECNRITTRAAPITVSLGANVSYDAFLVSMKADIANADTGIAQFSLRFNFVPNTSEVDDFCVSAS